MTVQKKMKQEKLSYPKMIMLPVQKKEEKKEKKMTREKAGRKKEAMKKEVLAPNPL